MLRMRDTLESGRVSDATRATTLSKRKTCISSSGLLFSMARRQSMALRVISGCRSLRVGIITTTLGRPSPLSRPCWCPATLSLPGWEGVGGCSGATVTTPQPISSTHTPAKIPRPTNAATLAVQPRREVTGRPFFRNAPRPGTFISAKTRHAILAAATEARRRPRKVAGPSGYSSFIGEMAVHAHCSGATVASSRHDGTVLGMSLPDPHSP
mmetsp:Transcript_21893/g.42544  ORF Transcript_21893/g.42544 Transcript_21893/m.42544 type:complete len:211 (-) Transcript_21893:10-642(-)